MSDLLASRKTEIVDSTSLNIFKNFPEKTPVSILQEILVKIGQRPTYIFNSNETNPVTFTCIVECMEKKVSATGKSKKEAKHLAARTMIDQLYEKTLKESTIEELTDSCNNELVKLHIMCKKYNLDHPRYIKDLTIDCPRGDIYHYHCLVTDFITEGKGETSDLAQRDSARKMIEELNDFFTASTLKNKNLEKDRELHKTYILPTASKDILSTEVIRTGNISESNTSNSLVADSKKLDHKHSALFNYLSQLANDCSQNINNKEVNISKIKLITLRKEMKQFLKLSNIDFYSMEIENTESDTYLFIIQLNSNFDLLEMSLGKTRDEAELRSMNKIIKALRKTFQF